MTYNMLGMYSFSKINSDDFDVTFEIPDNCVHTFSETGGEYFIAIELKPGETDPSTTFVPYTETAALISNVLVFTVEKY